MSLLEGLPSREVSSFGGAWPSQDAPLVDFRGALVSENVEFSTGQVLARHGFASIGAANTIARSMFAWYAPFSQAASKVDVVLAWYDGTNLNIANLYDPTSLVTVAPVSGTPWGATHAVAGLRLFTAWFTSAQLAACPGQVTTVKSDGTMVTDKLFSPPLTYTPSAPTEPGAGSVTAGLHRFGYIVEDRSGFTTRLSPDSGSVTPPDITSFQPIEFTAAGSKNIQFVLNTTWPTNAVAVSICMTTIDSLNQYYVVPGSRTTVTGGSLESHTITVDISDDDLAATGVDATRYLFKLTQTPSGTSPCSPSRVGTYGTRMVYKVTIVNNQGNGIDSLYISDKNDHQTITADQHMRQLPGQKPMTTFFEMGLLYVLGPHEIWAYSDNGDVPATWADPELIDGGHGTLSIRGVEVSPSGQRAWIADQSGFFVFTGAKLENPVNLMQLSDWNRINWGAAHTLQIKDDPSLRRVIVTVPLDGATTPTHRMTFYYADGLEWDQVKYSLDSNNGYAAGAIEIVRNELRSQEAENAKKLELWLGPVSSGPILRQLSDADTNPYRDNAGAIHSIYRPALFPGRGNAQGVLHHHGFRMRVKGSGSLAPVMYSIDGTKSFTCRTATLASAPNAELVFLGDIRSELATAELNTNTADTWWVLSGICWYYSFWATQR